MKRHLKSICCLPTIITIISKIWSHCLVEKYFVIFVKMLSQILSTNVCFHGAHFAKMQNVQMWKKYKVKTIAQVATLFGSRQNVTQRIFKAVDCFEGAWNATKYRKDWIQKPFVIKLGSFFYLSQLIFLNISFSFLSWCRICSRERPQQHFCFVNVVEGVKSENLHDSAKNEVLYYDLETTTDKISKQMSSNLAVLANSNGDVWSFWSDGETTASDFLLMHLIKIASNEKTKKKRILLGLFHFY